MQLKYIKKYKAKVHNVKSPCIMHMVCFTPRCFVHMTCVVIQLCIIWWRWYADDLYVKDIKNVMMTSKSTSFSDFPPVSTLHQSCQQTQCVYFCRARLIGKEKSEALNKLLIKSFKQRSELFRTALKINVSFLIFFC